MASRALLERNDINILVGAAVDADLFDINRDLHWGGIDRRIKQSVKTGQSRLEQFELDLSALNRRSWATQLSSFLDNIASLLRTRNLEQSKIFDDYVRQVSAKLAFPPTPGEVPGTDDPTIPRVTREQTASEHGGVPDPEEFTPDEGPGAHSDVIDDVPASPLWLVHAVMPLLIVVGAVILWATRIDGWLVLSSLSWLIVLSALGRLYYIAVDPSQLRVRSIADDLPQKRTARRLAFATVLLTILSIATSGLVLQLVRS